MREATARDSQILEKCNIPCLCWSIASGICYAIFTRGNGQVTCLLKTRDKELTRRRLEDLREKVGRLNTKTGRDLVLATYGPDDHSLDGGSVTLA